MRGNATEEQCNRIFDHLKNDQGWVCKTKLFQRLHRKGILNDDPRIEELWKRSQSCDAQLTRQSFVSLTSGSVAVIASALTSSNIIPDFETFTRDIDDLYKICSAKTDGKYSNRGIFDSILQCTHFKGTNFQL